MPSILGFHVTYVGYGLCLDIMMQSRVNQEGLSFCMQFYLPLVRESGRYARASEDDFRGRIAARGPATALYPLVSGYVPTGNYI